MISVERIKCETCAGKGRLKRVKGQTYRTMRDGRRGPRCHVCGGEGSVVKDISTVSALKTEQGEQ